MAHRILQQITSNVSKSPVIKGHMKLRSFSPQNDATISRNLNFVSPTSMSVRPNINFNEIRKQSKYIKEDDNIEADEDLPDELPSSEVQDRISKLVDEDYLIKFKKSLDDSNYPSQSAKEFPLNKRVQALSFRSPGQTLNEQIVNSSRTRSDHRRFDHRLDFEEVEEQADITYQRALRKMHKVGQKINMNQYKIDITSNPKLLSRMSNLKSRKRDRYVNINKSLQPSKQNPFGCVTSAKHIEPQNAFTIVEKPIEFRLMDDSEEASVNIQTTNENHSNYNQYKTFEHQKESDAFTDQMKMLEPNYQPQKRYRSLNKGFTYEKKFPVENTCKFTTQEVKSDLKACQSIINHLKGLDPDYVRPPVDKKGTNEVALLESTMNLINDYKNAVLSSRIDTLYHKIKARYQKNRFQKSTALRSAANKPIKVSVGSKFDLQQCSFPSPKNQSQYIKSTTNEKVLVPWPSFSDRRKFNMPNLTDIDQNTSVLHIPMEMKVPKSNKLEWKGKINKPVEVFLSMTRPYSTKTKIEDVVPAEDFKHIATTNVVNTPKFAFNSNDYKKSIGNINKDVDAVSNSKTVTKASIPSKQSKSKFLQQSSTTKPQLDIGSNIANKQDDTSMKPKLNFDTRSKISEGSTKIPRLKLPNLTVQNPDCVKKPEQQNYVHQVGKYSTNTKLNFVDPISNNVKVEKETNTSMTSCNTKFDLEKSFVSNSQKKTFENKRHHLEDNKTSTNSSPTTIKYLFTDINNVSNKKVSEPQETETFNTSKTIKKYCTASHYSSLRNTGKSECSARVIKKDSASIQQCADISIIGKQQFSKKVSALNNLNNSGSGAVLKKIDTSERSSTEACDFNMKMDTSVLQGTQRNDKNKLFPLQRASNTADSVSLSAAKEPTIKLMKTPHLSSSENVILKNPIGKLKVNHIIKAKNLETNYESPKSNNENKKVEYTNKGDVTKSHAGRGFNYGTNENSENYAELRSSDVQNKSSNSNKLVNPIFNNSVNNIPRRKLSMHSAFSIIKDIAVVNTNVIPSIRTYCTQNCDPHQEYTKLVRLKRLKKRPGFNDDFPVSSNWLLLKHCKTICEQLENPKMDDLMGYHKKATKKKSLPRLKRSNCPCIEENEFTKTVKLTMGPKKRPEYVVKEYNRNCIETSSICDENMLKQRADNIAKYEIKKKKLPNLLPKIRCFSTFSINNTAIQEAQCSSVTPSKKSNPICKQQSKKKVAASKTNSSNNIKMHNTISKSRLSYKSINISNRNINKRLISPYVSYSEHRLSKINSENELYEFHETPEYLQPNCCIIRPTFDLDPSPLNHLTNDLTYGENFMKIPKSSIQELNRYALATATASQQNIIQKAELKSVYKIDAKKELLETTKHVESYTEAVQFETIPQNTQSITEAPIIEDLTNSSIEETNIPEYNLKDVKEEMILGPQTSAIELKSNKAEIDLYLRMTSSSKQQDDHKNERENSTATDNASIIFSNASLIAENNMKESASLWDRIICYLKSKLDDFAEIQEEKSKPDLLLCSGDEGTGSKCQNLQKSDDIIEDNQLLKNMSSKNIAFLNSLKDLTQNQDSDNDVPENQERHTKTSSYQNFCNEYDALIINLKEREETLKAKYNYESATKLKSNIEHSKQIFKQNNLSPLTIQTRSYSNRYPKSTHNLIEYIKKIEQEKAANIDEDELEAKILNAIKVGIEVMKKSKLANATDFSNAEIFEQLDPISKAELQTINSSMGDIKDSYLWPLRNTKTGGVFKEGNNEAANSVQQFCNTGENHNYSVLEYEESEQRKTEELQKVLDEILKSNAQS